MADGILTPCNVARSWHWFRQVTAPCNVAYVALESWQWIHQVAALCNVIRSSRIMTLISPGDCTLQCGMWLWNRDSEFTKWQHSAMWYVAQESWHWIRQVAAPCSVAGGSGMTCHWIRQNVRYIGILHLVSISTTSPQSTYHSAPVSEILFKSDHPRQKMTSCRFQDGGSQPS